jgi:hypothetical protein
MILLKAIGSIQLWIVTAIPVFAILLLWMGDGLVSVRMFCNGGSSFQQLLTTLPTLGTDFHIRPK